MTTEKRVALNLGCGVSYLISPEWVNFDWQSNSKHVRKQNLLRKLSWDSNTCDLVYSSHLLEHLTQEDGRKLLRECFRVLKPLGTIRISIPDFEEMANAYIEAKKEGDLSASQFILTEIVDQCVRTSPSGSFPKWYKLAASDKKLEELIKTRTGVSMRDRAQSLLEESSKGHSRKLDFVRTLPQRVLNRLVKKYISLVLLFLPRWFRSYHVSKTTPGERHMWHYDFSSLSALLEELGFERVEKIQEQRTRSDFHEVLDLDFDASGRPIKGSSTMFVEASKPQ